MSRPVSAQELENLRRCGFVTQAVLFEGKNRVRVYEPDGDPPHGFSPPNQRWKTLTY